MAHVAATSAARPASARSVCSWARQQGAGSSHGRADVQRASRVVCDSARVLSTKLESAPLALHSSPARRRRSCIAHSYSYDEDDGDTFDGDTDDWEPANLLDLPEELEGVDGNVGVPAANG
jgi:hypothetical protein